MKILHTSDWHIGKQLSKNDFTEDFKLFFDWLINLIKEKEIDVLLMSGDLFDLSNPPQQALTMYYDFLKKMIQNNADCKIIITGGNHDSATLLDAPKEILNMLDISVVGGLTENLEDLFISVEKNNEKLVVAAVPFLKDKDIRKAAPGETYQEKTLQIKEGLANFFKDINQVYQEKHKDLPFIIMAHLFAHGAETSDSERDIQIGNQAGVDASVFGKNANYVALGHIHKPQKAGAENIRYSGSPLPFSFSERKDIKEVVILENDATTWNIKREKIPSFRKLIRFSGTMEEIKNQLNNYQSDSMLCDLGEVLIEEENHSNQLINETIELRGAIFNDKIKITNAKIEFKNKLKSTASFLKIGDDISNYSHTKMFEKRLEQEAHFSQEAQKEMLQTFNELLSEVLGNQN